MKVHSIQLTWWLLLFAVVGDLTRARAADTTAPIPLKIAKYEWILFVPDANSSAALPALRISGDTGKDGYWVGESWMGRKPEDVMPELDKLNGLDVPSPETAWETVSKLKLLPAIQMGIDIAIWDLYGRSQAKPVADLLGPRKRDKVPLYLAGIPDLSVQQNIDLAIAAKQRGSRMQDLHLFGRQKPQARSGEQGRGRQVGRAGHSDCQGCSRSRR